METVTCDRRRTPNRAIDVRRRSNCRFTGKRNKDESRLVHPRILPIRKNEGWESRFGGELAEPGETRIERMTKILLVDDSKFLRLATERALSRAGYEVSSATDGESALKIAREIRPDVILLDMLLPKMTGPAVLKALKEDPATAGIAVVVLTGLSQKNAMRLQQDGACAFLEKSDLGLDKGCEKLLAVLGGIVRTLNLEVPEAAK